MTNESIIHMDFHKPNNKLVNAQLEHFWCMDSPRANTDSQDSPWPGLEGNHHLPPYSILYACPWGLHPNIILSQDFQVGSLEIPKIGISMILEAHNFLCRPLIEMKSKTNLYPLSRAFQRYLASHLHINKSGQFLTFSCQESNWQFDSQPFFWP